MRAALSGTALPTKAMTCGGSGCLLCQWLLLLLLWQTTGGGGGSKVAS